MHPLSSRADSDRLEQIMQADDGIIALIDKAN